MSFNVKRFSQNGLSFVGLQDTATNTFIAILPQFGALLHAFEFPVEGAPLNIIDNYSDKDDLDQSLAISYKSSKLSPFVCRLRDGKYNLDGRDYEISQKFNDGNAIHGLLYNKPFKIVDDFADDNLAAVSLRYHYKKEEAGYPFDYVCDVRYTLLPQQTLQIETTILNLSEEAMPLADGWHPYFQLGGIIDNYEFQFSSDTLVEFDEGLIPTGKLIHDPSFANPSLMQQGMKMQGKQNDPAIAEHMDEIKAATDHAAERRKLRVEAMRDVLNPEQLALYETQQKQGNMADIMDSAFGDMGGNPFMGAMGDDEEDAAAAKDEPLKPPTPVPAR